MTAPQPWPVGRLAFDAARLPARSYGVGSFIAHWQTEQGGSLTVRHAARPDRALWASLPGQSFAGAAHVARGGVSVVYCEQSIEQISSEGDALLLTGTLASPAGSAVAYRLLLRAHTAKDVQLALTVDAPCNRVVLTYASDAHERFHGFGDTALARDMKGRRVLLTAAAQAAGRVAPHYLTSRLRSLFLDGKARAVFDLRQAERVQVCLHGARLAGHILYGVAREDLLATYAASTVAAPPATAL